MVCGCEGTSDVQQDLRDVVYSSKATPEIPRRCKIAG